MKIFGPDDAPTRWLCSKCAAESNGLHVEQKKRCELCLVGRIAARVTQQDGASHMLCKECATDQTFRAQSTTVIYQVVDQICQMAVDQNALKVGKVY